MNDAAPLLGPDGRAVIVALDHALASGQVPPLDRPRELLARILPSEPDGLILTYGMQRLLDASAPRQRWLTADYYATSVLPGQSGDLELQHRIWTVNAARAVGATGFKVLLVFGRDDPRAQLENVRYVADLIADARPAGLPVMVEAVLWGRRVPAGRDNDAELVTHAARVAFELGADVIKVPIPDDPRALETVTRALPVPVLLMGGPVTDPARLLRLVAEAMDAGAAGVALGRNVWQHPDPAAMIAALKLIVHRGARGDEALEALNSGGPA